MIRGLHHVTATVTDARADLAFYSDLLGLRLVKKTVNFDNTGVYHLYYGDELGRPSTLMTTFPYGGQGVRVGTHGAGQIRVTSLSVPPGALEYWRERIVDRDVRYEEPEPAFGEPSLLIRDPSGLRIELVETEADGREPWTGGGIPENAAIRGLHGVTFPVHTPGDSLELLLDVFGFQATDRTASRTRIALGNGGPGAFIDVVHDPDAPEGINGLGTVHHVAMAVPTAEEQLELRGALIDLGYSVTEVKDRQYFTSIYFREPGGVLYEIATDGPGFTIDEDAAKLGHELKLPPWEEPRRDAIAAKLPPLSSDARA